MGVGSGTSEDDRFLVPFGLEGTWASCENLIFVCPEHYLCVITWTMVKGNFFKRERASVHHIYNPRFVNCREIVTSFFNIILIEIVRSYNECILSSLNTSLCLVFIFTYALEL